MFCLFHKWKLVGLYYEEYRPLHNLHGLNIYELYTCDKCKKEKWKNIRTDHSESFNKHSYKIEKLKDKGFEDIYNYKREVIKNNLKG